MSGRSQSIVELIGAKDNTDVEALDYSSSESASESDNWTVETTITGPSMSEPDSYLTSDFGISSGTRIGDKAIVDVGGSPFE